MYERGCSVDGVRVTSNHGGWFGSYYYRLNRDCLDYCFILAREVN